MRALLFCHNANILKSDIVLGETLNTNDWLATVIHTSLFTDKRAANDELPEGETDPRGYWGDTFNGQSYGSLLWTIRREKITENLLSRVQSICFDALNWLLRDGHVDALNVQVQRSSRSRIEIIVITKRNGIEQPQTEILDAA